MFEYIKEYLKAEDVEYKENKRLSEFSSIKIGGNAKMIILPKNKTDFLKILQFFNNDGIEFKILGNMSNILPRDEEYPGVIIKTDKISEYSVDNNTVICDCGVKLPFLFYVFSEHGFSGLEELSGIPGQLGGSVYGNAGAYGRELADILLSCFVYDKKSRELVKLSASELGFSYRKSCFSNNEMALISARLAPVVSDRRTVTERACEFKEKRRASQPIGEPSLGSIFKRPSEGLSAGKLIDECGLRGFSLGGAQISSKHAGFIVNNGGATSDDVKRLIDIEKQAVFEKFGTELECEIEFM